MAGFNFLSDEDVALLKQWLSVLRGQGINTYNRPRKPIDPLVDTSPAVYVALTPSGGLPAAVTSSDPTSLMVPGSADCILYRLDDDGTSPPQLHPLGDGKFQTVYNTSFSAIAAGTVILVFQDRSGKWQAGSTAEECFSSSDSYHQKFRDGSAGECWYLAGYDVNAWVLLQWDDLTDYWNTNHNYKRSGFGPERLVGVPFLTGADTSKIDALGFPLFYTCAAGAKVRLAIYDTPPPTDGNYYPRHLLAFTDWMPVDDWTLTGITPIPFTIFSPEGPQGVLTHTWYNLAALKFFFEAGSFGTGSGTGSGSFPEAIFGTGTGTGTGPEPIPTGSVSLQSCSLYWLVAQYHLADVEAPVLDGTPVLAYPTETIAFANTTPNNTPTTYGTGYFPTYSYSVTAIIGNTETQASNVVDSGVLTPTACLVDITSVSGGGAITGVSVSLGGGGSDFLPSTTVLLQVNSGDENAIVRATTNAGGMVTGVAIYQAGSGYFTGTDTITTVFQSPNVTLSWSAVPGASKYRIYVVLAGSGIGGAATDAINGPSNGFIGESSTTTFTDNGFIQSNGSGCTLDITADATTGTIASATVANGGSGYYEPGLYLTPFNTVTGSGAICFATVVGGVVTSVDFGAAGGFATGGAGYSSASGVATACVSGKGTIIGMVPPYSLARHPAPPSLSPISGRIPPATHPLFGWNENFYSQTDLIPDFDFLPADSLFYGRNSASAPSNTHLGLPYTFPPGQLDGTVLGLPSLFYRLEGNTDDVGKAV